MNKEIVDLFLNYSYLTDEYIQEKLEKRALFPPNNYTAKDFQDLTINIFEIPYSTLKGATIEYL